MESYPDSATEDKVHFEDFCFFIVNYTVFVLVVGKRSWFQSKCNVSQELTIFIFLRIEEESKVVENVIKQVMHNDARADWLWELVNKVIVFFHFSNSIVTPVVFEMLVNLSVKWIGQGTVISEPREEGYPIVKFENRCFKSRTSETFDNLYETSHNETEKGHPTEHDDNTNDLLGWRDRIEVTISDSTQSCDREVTTCHKSVNSCIRLFRRVIEPMKDKGITFKAKLRSLEWRNHVEKAAHKVRDDYGLHNKT